MKAVRVIAIIVGVLLFLMGTVWVLQGAGVLNQGFMAGHRRWIVIGSGVDVVGVVLVLLGSLRRGKRGAAA